MRRSRGALMLAIAALAAALLPTPGARASASPINSIFAGQTVSGAAIPCTAQSDGTRVCHGTYRSSGGDDEHMKRFGGQPLAVCVTWLSAPASDPDSPYPLIIQSHGW